MRKLNPLSAEWVTVSVLQMLYGVRSNVLGSAQSKIHDGICDINGPSQAD